ncbi:MAG: tripartite tricarboxylate transporter substrate binding protein [Xanthobacteraceae bacterium]|nr:tripartite tricarboxylate transporter substrate binding protein [Xanthobacteraceae bacterium]
MIGSWTPGLAALALVIAAVPAQAQQFKPTRTIEFVVHGGPGSGNDVFARQLSTIIDQEKLSPVRVQVVNKPGGGSTSASNYMASKKNDPHVIACFTNIWLIDPLVQQAAVNRLQDMSPIARLVVEPALVVVLADSPYKTLGQFIDAAKASPGKLRWSGGSIMSRENTVRQLLMQKTGARWQFISFPSGGERLAALLGGHVEMMIVDPSEAGEQIRAGKFRAIAQVSARRLPGFPDIPTIQEAGFDIPDVPQMRGVVGAAGMSDATVAFYEDMFLKASQTPLWKKFVEESQLDGEFVRAKDLKPFLNSFEATLRDILKDAGVKVVR